MLTTQKWLGLTDRLIKIIDKMDDEPYLFDAVAEDFKNRMLRSPHLQQAWYQFLVSMKIVPRNPVVQFRDVYCYRCGAQFRSNQAQPGACIKCGIK